MNDHTIPWIVILTWKLPRTLSPSALKLSALNSGSTMMRCFSRSVSRMFFVPRDCISSTVKTSTYRWLPDLSQTSYIMEKKSRSCWYFVKSKRRIPGNVTNLKLTWNDSTHLYFSPDPGTVNSATGPLIFYNNNQRKNWSMEWNCLHLNMILDFQVLYLETWRLVFLLHILDDDICHGHKGKWPRRLLTRMNSKDFCLGHFRSHPRSSLLWLPLKRGWVFVFRGCWMVWSGTTLSFALPTRRLIMIVIWWLKARI